MACAGVWAPGEVGEVDRWKAYWVGCELAVVATGGSVMSPFYAPVSATTLSDRGRLGEDTHLVEIVGRIAVQAEKVADYTVEAELGRAVAVEAAQVPGSLERSHASLSIIAEEAASVKGIQSGFCDRGRVLEVRVKRMRIRRVVKRNPSKR